MNIVLTFQGMKKLGVPQESLDSFAPEFRQGMAARAAGLHDVGQSTPEHWEKPFGSPERSAGFVGTRGGEYFFMPGLCALHWLAELGD